MQATEQLSTAAKDFLERHAHDVKVSMLVGSQGVSEGVIEALDRRLSEDELVKIRVVPTLDEDIRAIADHLASSTGAAVCDTEERVITLFRAHPPSARRPTSLWVPN